MILPTPDELRVLRELPRDDLSRHIQEAVDRETDCVEALLWEAITQHLQRRDWTLDEVRNAPLVCQVDSSIPLRETYFYGGVMILETFPPRKRWKDGVLIFERPYYMRGNGHGGVPIPDTGISESTPDSPVIAGGRGE